MPATSGAELHHLRKKEEVGSEIHTFLFILLLLYETELCSAGWPRTHNHSASAF